MSPELQNATDLLTGLLANPVVYSTLLLVVLGLIPKSLLDKLPILGQLVTLVKTVLIAQTAKQEAKQVNAGAVIAENAVQGYEQLKNQGKVDSATAAAETTRIIAEKTGLSPEMSRILTEQAVKQMKEVQDSALVSGINILRERL